MWSRVAASVTPTPLPRQPSQASYPEQTVTGMVLVRVIILVAVDVLLELSDKIVQPRPPLPPRSPHRCWCATHSRSSCQILFCSLPIVNLLREIFNGQVAWAAQCALFHIARARKGGACQMLTEDCCRCGRFCRLWVSGSDRDVACFSQQHTVVCSVTMAVSTSVRLEESFLRQAEALGTLTL